MTEKSQVVLGEALKLTVKERAEVAERLISSLDETPDADVERAWQEEIHRRMQEVDSGTTKTIPWEEVQRRLRHAK